MPSGIPAPPPLSNPHPIIDNILAAPKPTHSRGQPHSGIFVAGVTYGFGPSSSRPINGLIALPKSSKLRIAQPHNDALALTLEVGKHLMKQILVDPGSVVDLLYLPALIQLGYKADNLRNPSRVLVGFNGTETLLLGEIVLPISASPVTALVPLTVIDESSSSNAILGHTWIHAMKA